MDLTGMYVVIYLKWNQLYSGTGYWGEKWSESPKLKPKESLFSRTNSLFLFTCLEFSFGTESGDDDFSFIAACAKLLNG